jgi:hypothetical protein
MVALPILINNWEATQRINAAESMIIAKYIFLLFTLVSACLT